MKAFVFPGQGAQFVGMGKDLYENSALAKDLFEKANGILGYRITDIMFEGTDEDLRQTKVTQPAVFLHSVISALCMGDDFKPEMTAGHSLGEFSALVAAGALSFEDGLKLVYARAMAMQKACEKTPSTMAAILALPDEKVEEICASVSAEGEVCVAANYNCPGQIVISGRFPASKGVRTDESSRSQTRVAVESRRSISFSVDGSGKDRTCRSHQCHPFPHSEMPGIPKRRRFAAHRSGGNQAESGGATHRSRTLDTDCCKNDSRRRDRLHRVWSRRSASRVD